MARAFNGTTGTVLSGTPPTLTYPLTVAYWGKTTTTSGTQVGVVLGNGNSDQYVSLYLNGAAASCFVTGQNAAAGNVSTNTWFHHAGVVASTTSLTSVLNGSAGSTNTTLTTASTPGSMYVGQGADGAILSWSGDIAEIAIWNVALTAAELTSLAAGISPLLIRPSALVSYMPLLGRHSPEIDLRGNMPLTVTGATASDHPRVFMPRGRPVAPKTAANGAITLNADQGSVTVTGYAATATFSVAAAQGTVSVSGQAATASFGMAAAQGSVAVSGQASTIALLTAAAQGSATVVGQAATVAWAMAGDQGSVAITGYDATFDLPATGNITMDADTGTVTIAGFPAAAAFAVQTEHGSISVTGQASAVLWGLNADLGTVALVGYDADFDGAEPAPATNIGVGYYPVRKRRRVKIGAEIFWDDQRAAIAAALERLRAASPAPEADSSAAPRPASREAEPGTEALVASAANDPVPELASAAEFAAYEAEVLAWERRRARNAQALAALLLTET